MLVSGLYHRERGVCGSMIVKKGENMRAKNRGGHAYSGVQMMRLAVGQWEEDMTVLLGGWNRQLVLVMISDPAW